MQLPELTTDSGWPLFQARGNAQRSLNIFPIVTTVITCRQPITDAQKITSRFHPFLLEHLLAKCSWLLVSEYDLWDITRKKSPTVVSAGLFQET
jgi:hypothetical protein